MRHYRAAVLLSAAVAAAITSLTSHTARANTPVVVKNEAGFEGLEEPTVLYFPSTNTFTTGDTFQNHVDEGGGMFRDTLRNNYATLGWWDGDGADPGNTDRQRSEPKGIVGLGHQQVGQTFEYSFDFRTDPTFTATSSFDHIFQLKATNGDDSPPLATISLYKNGSGIQGRVDSFSDGASGTPQTETVPDTFNYIAGQWIHFVIRITPCAQGQTTGGIQLSVNGGPFVGITNAAIDLQGSTDFRPKFGFYREISISNGVTNDPAGVSWVEHRTITGYQGTSNVLTWQGGLNNNTWDTAATANFLNGNVTSTFNTIDQINFTGVTNTTINIAGNVWPGFADVNSSANYTFQGTGSITGGVLRKDGTGTLTLATTNSYAGLTDITNGTLFVTGSIGNNSLVSLTGGTLKLGSATALGTANTNGVQIAGGTMDLNGFPAGTIAISVQGTGLNNAGAIINSGAQQISAMNNVTLTGDTTLGGTGRWDIRAGGGANATLSTGGSAFNLTKTGANQISLVGTTVDPTLGNITISQGTLAFQTSTSSMGDPTKSLTISPGATLDFFNTANIMSKIATINGGTILAESGTGTQNTFAGPISVTSSGATFTANSGASLTLTGLLTGTGPLTKNSPGSVTLTSNASTWSGALNLNAGLLSIGTTTQVSALTLAGSANNWSGDLNLAGNKLILETTASAKSAALATLRNQIAFGATQSAGITSANLPANQTLVASDNAIAALSFFGGHAVDANSLLITAALNGDSNFDGVVNVADLNTLAANWQKPVTDWSQGDFNGDGIVNIADLNTLAANWQAGAGAGSGSTGDIIAPALAVPEPASAIFLLPFALAMKRRSRQAFSGH